MRPGALTLASSFLALLLFLVSGVSVAQDAAETYGAGDRISKISLNDQHDEAQAVDASTRIILFSRDMDGGKLFKEALADTAEGFLAEKGAVYISDISGMPSLVARMFALPSMRKRPYPMLLDRTGEDTSRLPDVEEQATVIFLKELLIERVEHVDSANGMRGLLGLEALSTED